MAKIALELERAIAQRAGSGAPGKASARTLAVGDGWSVDDVLCTSGPQDRSFEERHSGVSIAIVAAGSFQYRASKSRPGCRLELMTPGSLLLGNLGQSFECGHEHGVGDRCIAFRYTPEYFETLAIDAGVCLAEAHFHVLRVPPVQALSPVVARACAALTESAFVAWEELSLQLAVQTLRLLASVTRQPIEAAPAAVARVTRTVRMIERQPSAELSLSDLAQEAGLSPYHFLRTFERLTGLTPHQFVLRARLREAALRLSHERTSILNVALDCGFGDISNFNRAFRREFGMSPRLYQNGLQVAAKPVQKALRSLTSARERYGL